MDDAAERDANARLRRLRGLSWLLDRSIPVGRWRIGLDPLIGIFPGIGDWVGGVLSLYVVYEGARLGLPNHVLARMMGNVLVETLVGVVPVLGDLFDFVWQANTRNLALVERHYRPELRERSLRRIGGWLLGLAVFVLLLTAATLFLAIKGLAAVLN